MPFIDQQHTTREPKQRWTWPLETLRDLLWISVAVLALSSAGAQAQTSAPIKDADGNVLPPYAAKLVGWEQEGVLTKEARSFPEGSFVMRLYSAGLGLDWYKEKPRDYKYFRGGGYVGPTEIFPSNATSAVTGSFGIGDELHRKTRLKFAVVVRYWPDKKTLITDVLQLAPAEITAWGKDCDEAEHNIPAGYRLGAVLDLRTKLIYSKQRSSCDAPSRMVKRAYLLNVETGKLQRYSLPGLTCRSEGEPECVD